MVIYFFFLFVKFKNGLKKKMKYDNNEQFLKLKFEKKNIKYKQSKYFYKN